MKAFLYLSAFLFSAGIACMFLRRNIIQILMGLELILNAAALNFATFAHYGLPAEAGLRLSGQVVAIFIIALAAAEAALALALILAVGKLFKNADIDSARELKG